MKFKKLKIWFTIAELMIVITIIWLLSTIWFVSFKNYTKTARDSNRINTIWNFEIALNMYMSTRWKFPLPDIDDSETALLTWSLVLSWSEVQYSYLWVIWRNVWQLLWVNKVPSDPLSWNKYIYAVNQNQDKYQIATVFEKEQAYKIWINKAFANTNYKAKVIWNHLTNVKISNNWRVYLTTVPSLIFDKTWWNKLNSTWSFLIINWWENLPYKLWTNDIKISKTSQDLIKTLRSNQNAKIVTIDITDIINSSSWTLRQAKIKELFWTWWDNIIQAWIKSSEIFASLWLSSTWANEIDILQNIESSISWWWTSFIKQNCSLTTFNWYTITPLSHLQSWVFEKNTPTNWKTQVTATCNDKSLSYWWESILCNTNYVKDWSNNCILDTCTWLAPAFSQINWTQWTSSWSYSTTAWVCKFICQNWYTYKSWTITCEKNTWFTWAYWTCTSSSQSRTVTCRDWNSTNLTDDKCLDTKPSTTQSCDSTAPVLSSLSPSWASNTPQVKTLSLSTNEISTCKYSTTDISYDSMATTFSTTNSISHSTSYTSAEWTNNIYVRCMDSSWNKNTSSSLITFKYDSLAPTWWTFKINNDAASTTTTAVTLNITCPIDASSSTPIEVAYWNTTWPTNWTTCTSSISHTLTTWDWTKTVYMRFRDSLGNTTSEITDNINLSSDLQYLIIPIKDSWSYTTTLARIDLINNTRYDLWTLTNFYIQSSFSLLYLPNKSWILSTLASTSNTSFNNFARISPAWSVSTNRYYSSNFNDYWDFYSSLAFDRTTWNVIFANTPHYVESWSSNCYRVEFNPLTLSSFSSSVQTNPIYYAAQNWTLTFLYDLNTNWTTSNQSTYLINIWTQSKSSYDNNRAFLQNRSDLSWSNSTTQIASNPSRQHYAILSSTEMMVNMFGKLAKVTISWTSVSTTNASDLPQLDTNPISEVSNWVWYLSSTKTFRKNYPNQWGSTLDISWNSTFDFPNTTYYNYFWYWNKFYMIWKTSWWLLRVSIATIDLTNWTLTSATSNTYWTINDLYQFWQYKNNS